MIVVTVEQFDHAILVLWFAGFLGGALAVWVGRMFGESCAYLFWLLRRRSARWRRFDRLMRRAL